MLSVDRKMGSMLAIRSDRRWKLGLTCLSVMSGFQDISSFKKATLTVPDGYMLGWKRAGLNLPVQEQAEVCASATSKVREALGSPHRVSAMDDSVGCMM